MAKRSLISVLIFVLFVTACNLNTAQPEEDINTEPASASTQVEPVVEATEELPTETEIPLPEHRIGIRVVDGVGEFYNKETGEKFVPRGFNYLHMATQEMAWDETRYQDATFSTDVYDPAAASDALSGMHDLGYNVVRVFLTDSVTGFVGHGQDFLPGYIDNLADFLHSAAENEMYVLFTIDWLPGGRYGELQNNYCCDKFGSANVQILTTGGVEAIGNVYADLYKTLVAVGAPVENIFSFELRNEVYFPKVDPPFSLSETVTAANGKSYDMSSEEERKALIEEGLVYYIDRAREIILETDPTALVSAGFFVPEGPIPVRIGDDRQVATAPAIWESTADFIDLHPYPGFNFNMLQHVTNFGMEGMEEKPIIMGEFGAFKQNYTTASQGAKALKQWQIDSCQYGFDGWLVWHWDTSEDQALWNALDADGVIANMLAPINQPDPCSD